MGSALLDRKTLEGAAASPLHVLAALITGRSDSRLDPNISSEIGSIVSWPQLVDVALQHNLGPMLLWAVSKQGIDATDDPLWKPLVMARNQTAINYMLASTTQAKIQSAFDAAGIPCVWLKGIALAPTIYPAPELRPMVDVDVLVPYKLRKDALAIAESAGYRAAHNTLFDGTEDLKHHYCLRGNASNAVQLELHFRLLDMADKLLNVDQLDWFWAQTQVVQDRGRAYRCLLPEAHVLYLSAHALLQHGEADFQLLRYCDLHFLIMRSPAFDWQKMVEHAIVLGWTYVIARALTITRSYFATELPPGIIDELHARRPSHENTVHVQRRQKQRTLSEVVWHNLVTMRWSNACSGCMANRISSCGLYAPALSFG